MSIVERRPVVRAHAVIGHVGAEYCDEACEIRRLASHLISPEEVRRRLQTVELESPVGIVVGVIVARLPGDWPFEAERRMTALRPHVSQEIIGNRKGSRVHARVHACLLYTS